MDSAKNRTFETSWSRLESALNLDDGYMYNDSRPKTTASVRKYSPVSQRLAKQHSGIRSTSTSKSSRNRLKRPVTAEIVYKTYQLVPGLNLSQVQDLYIAKCQDLSIPVLGDQERRFINCCAQHFVNRKFIMKESGLGYQSAKIIGDILKDTNYFAYVDLSKNLLKDFGAIKLVRRVALSNIIVHLDLSSNEISPEGSELLLEILNGHSSLVSLDLSSHEGLHRNRLSLLGAQAVGRVLKNPSVLSVLNLAGTGIGPEGLEYIIQGLQENLTLSSLNLSNNMLGGKIIEKLAVAITYSDLRELNLGMNKISNEGCEYIALMLSGGYQGYCTIIKLDISYNEITTVGLTKLMAALRINNQITYLTLKKNDFSKGLSLGMTQFLTENITLENLDLSYCNIICDGLNGFAEGLVKNNGLKTLNLSNNLISDKGIEIICQGLSKNKVLKSLDLSSNKIKDKGGLIMASAIQENETLAYLYMKNNSLKDETAQKFSELSRWKRNLLKLNLDLNPLNFKYLEIIKNNVKANYEHQQKSIIPKLQETIGRLQFRGSALEDLHNRIIQKQKERFDMEKKLKTKGVRLEDVRESENLKFKALKNEYTTLRELSQKMSYEIDDIYGQINVKSI